MSTPNISIEGSANFTGETVNNGTVSVANFTDNAFNAPTAVVGTADFSFSSVNQGTVTGSAVFSDSATNASTGSVAVATFDDTATNEGAVSLSAFFNGDAINASTASVSVAVFTASATNYGTVTGDAIFEGNASNGGTGVIQGNAIFADTTTNTGAVSGNVEVAATATNTGTVGGNTTVYEHAYHDTTMSYWWDNTPLADGAIVYTGAYTNTVAANATFSIEGYDVSTDGGGLATLTSSSNWYADTSSTPGTVILNGTVTQTDLGSGVVAASFNDNGKLNANFTIGSAGGDFSLAVFAKFEGGNGREDRIFNPDTTSSFAVFRNTNNLIELNNVGVGTLLNSTVPITDSDWHYIYVVKNQTEVSIYIDGINYGTSNLPITFQSSDNNYIGGYANGNTFVGKIAGLHLRIGTIDISDSSVPTSLPTSVTGTELLLNFGATAVPTAAAPKSGAYSYGYFADGLIDGSYDAATPTDEAQDDNKWYTYSDGLAFAANGPYSNGYYSAGERNSVYFNSAPQRAADTQLWYTYSGGTANLAGAGTYQAANNLWYTFDGVGGAEFATGTYQAANDLWYAFDGAGGRAFATGTYSIGTGSWYTFDGNGGGAYANGVVQATDGLWYTFANGGRGLFAPGGTYQAANNLWYTFDSNGGAVFATGTTSESGSYYRYNGAGGKIIIYYVGLGSVSGAPGEQYFSNNITGLAIGNILYTLNGEHANATSTITFFGITNYYVDIDSNNGEILNISDNDPYN